jgi:hypothetical protein
MLCPAIGCVRIVMRFVWQTVTCAQRTRTIATCISDLYDDAMIDYVTHSGLYKVYGLSMKIL